MLRWAAKRRSQASIAPSVAAGTSSTTNAHVPLTLTSVDPLKQATASSSLPPPAHHQSLTRQPSRSTAAYKYTVFVESVKEELQCSVCLEEYQQPRLLMCGHSFCTECLKSISHAATIRCPTCRHFTKFPQPGIPRVEDLPMNYAISNVLDILHGSTQRDILPCPVHKSEQVKFFCRTCDVLLCTECIVVAAATKVPALQAAQPPGRPSSCSPKGKSKVVQSACATASGDHFRHDLATLREAAEELYHRLTSNLCQAQATINLATAKMATLEEKRVAHTECMDAVEADVRVYFDEIQAMVEARRVAVLANVQVAREENELKMKQQVVWLHGERDKLEGWSERARELLDRHRLVVGCNKVQETPAEECATTAPTEETVVAAEDSSSTDPTTTTLRNHRRMQTRIRSTRDTNGIWVNGPALKDEFDAKFATMELTCASVPFVKLELKGTREDGRMQKAIASLGRLMKRANESGDGDVVQENSLHCPEVVHGDEAVVISVETVDPPVAVEQS